MAAQAPSSGPATTVRRLLVALVWAALAATTVLVPSAAAAPNCPPEQQPCDPPPEPPPPSGFPAQPWVRFGAREQTKLTVGFSFSANTTRYRLDKQVGTSWVTKAQGPVAGAVPFVDAGLTADTRYCYRVTAFNSVGSRPSIQLCNYTKGRPGQPVFRVQLRLTTGSPSDAGTDNAVHAWVGGSITSGSGGLSTATGGVTKINPARNELRPGQTHNYDLTTLANIDDVDDIHELQLIKPGTDNWCVSNATLLINGAAVYSTNLGSAPGGCRWIDGNAYVVAFNHAQLRADPWWQGFQVQIPPLVTRADGKRTLTLTIPRDELESRIEAQVGQAIVGTPMYWGDSHSRGVTATRKAADRTGVLLDLKAEIDNWDNPDVDVWFDLVASTFRDPATNVWNVKLDIQNFDLDADFDWWADIVGTIPACGPVLTIIIEEPVLACLPYIEGELTDQVGAAITKLAPTLGISAFPENVTATFQTSGALDIVLLFPPAAQTNPNPPLPGPGPICCISRG
jgi:hypothetical protein